MDIFEQLIRDEGRILKMYEDSKGISTIGVGHNLESTPISKAASDQILTDDVRDTVNAIRGLAAYQALDPVRQGCLINMAFTLGVAGLRNFPRCLRACETRDYVTAATEIRDSKWWRTDAPVRAERIAKQMETGVWQ